MIRSCFLLSITLLFSNLGLTKNSFPANDLSLSISVVSTQQPNCSNPFGSITVVATGGVPNYTYAWSNGATGATISGLDAGVYDVVATDSEGNQADLQITLDEDFEAPFADAGDPIHVACTNTVVSLNGNASSGPNFTFQWVASNGGRIVSGAQTLSPVVDHIGSYQLTVTNLTNGCTASETTLVTAQNVAPAAIATGGVINCLSSTVTLDAEFTTLHTTFKWQGPGGFMSNLENPVVSVIGNYVFTVTDTLTGCIGKSTAVVTSNFAVPNADAQGGGTITCAQPTVQLFGISTTPNASFSWSGPNGFLSFEQNPVVSTGGVYTLTVQNPVNGCTASDALTVGTNLVAPIPTAAAIGTLTCSNQMVQLSGNSNTPGVTYSWVGPNNFMANLQNPAVSVPGVYTLTVKNPINGCTGSASATVTQNIAQPNVSATGGVKTCSSPAVTLMGNSTTPGVSYSWTGPNGFNSSQQNPSVLFVGTYTLRVTNPVNGCSATANATVSQNVSPPSISASSPTITCSNPSVQINTNSSPQGLTYIWTGPNNFSSTEKNPTVSASGFYAVTATNPANGCTNSTTVFTNANTTPPFAFAGENKSLNCFFNTILINGSFSSTGTNFTYLWTTWDGNIVGGATTLYPSVNEPGTYTLRVTNTQNGCVAFDSMTVTQSLPVTATITQTTPVHCSGGSNGTATVAGGGGSLFYNFNWSNGRTTAAINGLSAGTYTVTVMDTEGCSATATATIAQLVLDANINVSHQTVPGVNNGSATVTGFGGTAPYTVLWSTGAVTLTIGSLAPGPYSVTVTDSKGCTVVKTTNVNAANCILTGSAVGTNLSCFGVNNGSATINLSSSLNPITYAWSNGGSTKTINGLAPGTYTVTATDASACTVVQSVLITQPNALLAAISAQSNPRCPNSTDGFISAGASGGTQPFTYKWSNNASTASISSLTAGNYTLTVTDANNCTSTVSAVLSAPSPISIAVVQKTDVACASSNDGAISVSVQGGVAPYTYFWSNGATQASTSGLSGGTYTLTVTDHNDCSSTISATIAVQDQIPPTLQLKNATVDLDNNGFVSVSATIFDNGSFDNCGITTWTVTPNTFNCSNIGQNIVTITATDLGGNVSTGTAMLTVQDNIVPTLNCPSNIVTGACNPTVQFNAPQVLNNCAFNPNQLVQTNGLPSGAHFPTGSTIQSFRYTDEAGNIGECSFIVTVDEGVDILNSSTPASCAGNCDGSATLTQISGTPIQIFWSNGQSSPHLSGLCPGNYTATISDSYNCTQTQSVEISVQDIQPPSLACPSNIAASYCAPTVYNQPLVNDNCPVNPANIQLISGLPSGVIFPVGNTLQTFSYTDGGGNTGQCSFTVSVAGPANHSAAVQSVTCANLCNGFASLTLSGGDGPFSIQWSNGQVGNMATNLCAGNFGYSITDVYGCAQAGTVAISQPAVLNIVVDQVLNDVGNAGVGSIQITVNGGVPPYSYHWTRNGQFFAATMDIANLFAGQYIGVVTDANGCTVSSGSVTITSVVSTQTPNWTQELSIAPNPATEAVWLDFSAPLGQSGQLQLIAPNGRVARQRYLEPNDQQLRLDVSDLPAGLWFVQLRLADGQSTTRKLVVAQ